MEWGTCPTLTLINEKDWTASFDDLRLLSLTQEPISVRKREEDMRWGNSSMVPVFSQLTGGQVRDGSHVFVWQDYCSLHLESWHSWKPPFDDSSQIPFYQIFQLPETSDLQKKNSVIRLIALPRTVEFRYVRSVCGPMSVLWTGVSFTLPLVVITWTLQDPGIPFSN